MQISQSKKQHHSRRGSAAVFLAIAAVTALIVVTSSAASDARAATLPHGERGPAVADTTISIHSTGSNLEFLPSRISAKQGTRVTIRYANEGTLPHNIVLVKDEADINMLGKAAFEAKETGYVPLEHADRLIAYSDLVVPGETVEVTFEVPPAGEYFFVCLYPGHYNMMVGTLRSLS
jgi:azurin